MIIPTIPFRSYHIFHNKKTAEPIFPNLALFFLFWILHFLLHGRKRLTHKAFRSIFIAIFRKGALLMNWFGFVPAMITANMMDHVRTIVVYDDQKTREE